MIQVNYIGPAPSNENCAQVGSSNYREHALRECRIFAQQLRRMFGQEPIGAAIKVKAQRHDFGTYYEVVVEYDEGFVDAIRYAHRVEDMAPEYWDREAQQQLRSFKP